MTNGCEPVSGALAEGCEPSSEASCAAMARRCDSVMEL